MSERNEDPVRDFERDGDVGEGSHSSFATSRDGSPAGNDERLGSRGRSTGGAAEGLLDDLEADRAARRARDQEG
jgi:hypothetical protein